MTVKPSDKALLFFFAFFHIIFNKNEMDSDH